MARWLIALAVFAPFAVVGLSGTAALSAGKDDAYAVEVENASAKVGEPAAVVAREVTSCK